MADLANHRDENEGAQPVPSFFDSAVSGLARLATRIAALLLIFMLAIIGYSVVQRYFFGTPVTWTDELTGYLVVAIVMLGAGETLMRGEHITVDLLTAKAHGTARKAIQLWGNLAIIAVAVTLMIGTRSSLSYSYNFDILSNGYLEVPMWIPQSSMMIGGALLLLVALMRIINLLRDR